jgi:hypothetical protein
MILFSKIPTLEEAARLMNEAESRNPGPWVPHSIFTAQAAKLIASLHPALDPSLAYRLAYLHDIGRREGVSDMRHTLDGYHYLKNQGYDDAAQICLTHSFPIQNIHAGAGQWDCSPKELEFAEETLSRLEYTAYDRLVQLCDALALPSGFCLIEIRLVDVALRHGFNGCTIEKWKAYFKIQQEFEQVIGQSIYAVLPGIVNNTFG